MSNIVTYSDPLRTETFPKNIAIVTAFSSNELTLRKQKALHTIMLTVREQFFMRNPHIDLNHLTENDVENTNTTFNIEEDNVMQAMGFKDKSRFYSYNQVLSIFEQIADQTIGFDGLGIARSKAEREKWVGFSKVLGSVDRVDGFFKFNMPPKMVFSIICPEIFYFGPVSWSGYKTKFTAPIYESCLYYFQNGHKHTDWFEISMLRKMTNTESTTFDEYNKFKTRVLQKTLNNINSSDELDLHVTFEEESFNQDTKKSGRKKVTHIRFLITEKVGHTTNTLDARNSIVLNASKSELEGLGIPKNQIEDVVAECHDSENKLSLHYLKWCISKGHELRQLSKFKPNSPFEIGSEPKIQHNFGGYFRKHIIRGKKDDWFTVDTLVTNFVFQKGHTSSKLADEELNNRIVEIKKRLKRKITFIYLKSLSEQGFTNLQDSFLAFLKAELPHTYTRYINGELGDSLFQMAENNEFCLNIYLDYCHKIFTPDAYKWAMSTEAQSCITH